MANYMVGIAEEDDGRGISVHVHRLGILLLGFLCCILCHQFVVRTLMSQCRMHRDDGIEQHSEGGRSSTLFITASIEARRLPAENHFCQQLLRESALTLTSRTT